MNQMEIFKNPEFGTIRAVEIDGEPWLVGKDVALALGYDDLCFWDFNVIICPYGDRYGCCTSACFCISSRSWLCSLLSLQV